MSGHHGSALVVIPCLNEAESLPGLLAQMVTDDAAALIIVADGGSSDASRAIAAEASRRDPRILLLDNPDRIQSAGINAAVRRHGRGCRWLVRVDAHCGYPDRYVARLIEAVAARQAAAVVVPMRTEGRSCFQRAVAAAQNSVIGTGGSPHRHVTAGRYVDHGHHALIALEPFMAVGGYDESFSHNEDAELDQRLLAAGCRIWLEPALALTYRPRSSPLALFRQYRRYGIGRAMTAARHRQRPALRQLLPLAVAPCLAAALLGLLLASRWPACALLALPAAAWAAVCLLAGATLALGRRSWCALGAGFAAMLMHLGWSIGNLAARVSKSRPGEPPSPLAFEA